MPESPVVSLSIIPALAATIALRKAALPQASYVAGLMKAGPDLIRSKISEEAKELQQAARTASPADCTCEAADLVFHALVMVVWSGASWPDVESELSRRFGISGLEEKAARAAGNN
jgi:phosphoribosyl-ATP pyrophosphohydrolase